MTPSKGLVKVGFWQKEITTTFDLTCRRIRFIGNAWNKYRLNVVDYLIKSIARMSSRESRNKKLIDEKPKCFLFKKSLFNLFELSKNSAKNLRQNLWEISQKGNHYSPPLLLTHFPLQSLSLLFLSLLSLSLLSLSLLSLSLLSLSLSFFFDTKYFEIEHRDYAHRDGCMFIETVAWRYIESVPRWNI